MLIRVQRDKLVFYAGTRYVLLEDDPRAWHAGRGEHYDTVYDVVGHLTCRFRYVEGGSYAYRRAQLVAWLSSEERCKDSRPSLLWTIVGDTTIVNTGTDAKTFRRVTLPNNESVQSIKAVDTYYKQAFSAAMQAEAHRKLGGKGDVHVV